MSNKKISMISTCLVILILLQTIGITNASVYQRGIFDIEISYTPVELSDFEFSNNGSVTNHIPGDSHVIIPTTDSAGDTVTAIENFAINNDRYIEILEIPETVTEIGWLNLLNCPNLHTIILHAEDPITRYFSILGLQLGRNVKIYVPDGTINMYKESWYLYRDQIYPYSNYNKED